MLRKSFPIIALLCIAIQTQAQDFWIKKPYQQWSLEETKHMLQDSPWASTTTLRSAGNPAVQISGNQAVVGGRESDGQLDPSVTYILQICSAPPIRQAMVRKSQIEIHYDAMSAGQKAKIDVGAEKYLNATFTDRIAVCVNFSSNVGNYSSSLGSYWSSQSAAKLNDSVFLTAGKGRFPLSGYAYREGTFQFIFPRPKQITADTPLGVEFVHPNIDLVQTQRILLNLKPKKMLINGEPAL